MQSLVFVIDPLIALKNNSECIKYVKYTTEDKNAINMLYMPVIFELINFCLPILFLLIILICRKIYPIMVIIILCFSTVTIGFCLDIIVITKQRKSVYMPIDCYDYIPKHAFDTPLEYQTLYNLSIVSIIFCVITICISVSILISYYKKRNPDNKIQLTTIQV